MIRNHCQHNSMGARSFGWKEHQLNLKKSKLTDLVPSAMVARWNRVKHFLLGENCLSPLVALQLAELLVHLNTHRIPTILVRPLHLGTEVANIIVTWESSYKLESSFQRHLQIVLKKCATDNKDQPCNKVQKSLVLVAGKSVSANDCRAETACCWLRWLEWSGLRLQRVGHTWP